MKKHLVIIFALIFFGCSESEEPITDNSDTEFGEVFDADGNKYLTVSIGDQVWMAENLKTTIYSNGEAIPELRSNSDWGRPTSSPEVIKPGWSYYENDPSNNTFNGKLYNWYAISDSRNCCPNGWGIPTKSDFEKLLTFLGSENEALRKLKKEGTIWPQIDLTNNQSGFSAFPSGVRNNGGSFDDLGLKTSFWVSDPFPNANSVYYGLAIVSGRESEIWNGYSKEFGLSVRCLKK